MDRFGKEQNITTFIGTEHFSDLIKAIRESMNTLIILVKKKMGNRKIV